jgi:hypothetical protein
MKTKLFKFWSTFKLGENKLGYNKLGYNEFGYNEHLVITIK